MAENEGVPGEAGQGATNVSPAPPPPPAANVSPPAAPPPPPDPWYKSALENPEDRGYAEVKGWKTPADLLGSYRQLEKMRGVPPERLLTLPEDMSDAEAMKPILAKLGFAAPEKAEDYGFSTMEGVNPERGRALEAIAMKVGVPKALAEAAFKEIAALDAAELARMEQDDQEAAAADRGAFKAKYGEDKANAKIESARRFVRAYGMDEETLTSIEGFMGASKFWEFFSAAGERMGEAEFVTGEKTNPGFALSADGARAKRAELMADKEFMAKFLAGDRGAKEKMSQLNRVIGAAEDAANAARAG